MPRFTVDRYPDLVGRLGCHLMVAQRRKKTDRAVRDAATCFDQTVVNCKLARPQPVQPMSYPLDNTASAELSKVFARDAKRFEFRGSHNPSLMKRLQDHMFSSIAFSDT